MTKIVCSKCKEVFKRSKEGRCPDCGSGPPQVYEFRNSDEYLKKQIPLVVKQRQKAALEGLVGCLECVIINLKQKTSNILIKDLEEE